jgi:hypothetical protein
MTYLSLTIKSIAARLVRGTTSVVGAQSIKVAFMTETKVMAELMHESDR